MEDSPRSGRAATVFVVLIVLALVLFAGGQRITCAPGQSEAELDAIWSALAQEPPDRTGAREGARQALRAAPMDSWRVFVFQITDALVAEGFPESFAAPSAEVETDALAALGRGELEQAREALRASGGPTETRLRFWLRLLAAVDAARLDGGVR